MPSVSKAQQSIMGQAYGVKTGKLKQSDINPKYRSKILSIAKRMSKSELGKFASTKTKGLPHHVKEEEEIVTNETEGISTITPLVNISGAEDYTPQGPAGIKPFLDTEAKQKRKGKGNMENLKDYRDWISGNKG